MHRHNIGIVKEIILPLLGLDKILTLVGLYFVVRTFQYSNRLSRVNFITLLTQNHRDIWSKIHADGLADRILGSSANPLTLTKQERAHILNVILHSKTSYEAHIAKIKRLTKEEIHDIGTFLNYPLVNQTWQEIQPWHEKHFIKFIEKAKYIADPINSPKPTTFYSKSIVTLKQIYKISFSFAKTKTISVYRISKKYWTILFQITNEKVKSLLAFLYRLLRKQ